VPNPDAARLPEAAEVVRRFGGRALGSEILRFTTEHRLRRALDCGAVVRASRGIYVLGTLDVPRAAAARCRGVLSHDSAAAEWGLGLVFPPRAVQVTAPRGAKPPHQPGVVVHRVNLRADEIDGDVTAPLRTVLDCAQSLPFREALAVADSAAHVHPGFLATLRDAAQEHAGRGFRRCRRVAAAASALAENAFESALRGTLLDAGLTGFEPQVGIRTAAGTARVDLADRLHRIVAEADSFEWHGGRQALAADCRRYDELCAAGWTVLRFAWEQVMFEPEWVAGVVRSVAAGSGPRDRAGFTIARAARSAVA
jgi:very-short-patch-repair endonuclease